MTEPDRPPRILHVEDEALNRVLLRAILARATDPRLRSAILDEAEDLAQARAVLESEQIDLVLLDVRLPDGNGLDLVREIKARDPNRAVLVMSASVLPAERDDAVRAGSDGFVPKPYINAELLETMARLLRHVQPNDPAD
jgi:two-component system KDP operon response regulator KdpE